ncbi:tetratricopeptide repeat-containing sensor histidine kinase [Flavitalea flava]
MSQNRFLPGFLTGLSFLLLITTTFAQSVKAARAHHGTEGTYSLRDSIIIFSLLGEADRWKEFSRLDSATILCQRALKLSKEKKMLRGEAYSYLALGDVQYRLSEWVTMKSQDSMGLQLGLQLKDSFLIALAYYGLGQWAQGINRKEDAFADFKQALAIRFEKDQSSYTAGVYNDLGYLYGNKGELDQQREWYLKAMRLYDRIKDSTGMAQTFSNLSGSSLELGNKQDAITYALRALQIREKKLDKDLLALSCNNLSQIYLQTDSMDQAIRFQQEGLKYAALSGSKIRLAQSYTSMSLLLNRKGKNKEALDYEKKAILLCRELEDSSMLARRCIAAAVLSGALKDSVAAIGYFDEAAAVALAINDKYNLRDLYLYRTVFYKERKDFFKAYENLKKYHAYKDSIINKETTRNIAEIQTKYETEKKDMSIGELRASDRIHQLEIDKQKAIITGNLAEALRKENEIDLLSQAGELKNTKIAQQNAELDRRDLQAKSKEQELQLAKQEKELNQRKLQQQEQTRNIIIGATILLALMAAGLFNRYQLKKKLQQQEALLEIRNNIARDLHDELGSTLTSIHILSQVSRNHLEKEKNPSRAFSLIEKITEQSRQMQQSMSDIVWAIKSDNDKIGNMTVRMREYLAQTLESRNITIKFEAAEELLKYSFSMQQRKDIFLIFKEAVNNAAKYAGCTLMEVSFRLCNHRILLEVKDNGVGFEPGKLRSTNGLNNMRARSASLAGECHIKAEPGKGTTILLDLPVTT